MHDPNEFCVLDFLKKLGELIQGLLRISSKFAGQKLVIGLWCLPEAKLTVEGAQEKGFVGTGFLFN